MVPKDFAGKRVIDINVSYLMFVKSYLGYLGTSFQSVHYGY